jgi:hypothetical protein
MEITVLKSLQQYFCTSVPEMVNRNTTASSNRSSFSSSSSNLMT